MPIGILRHGWRASCLLQAFLLIGCGGSGGAAPDISPDAGTPGLADAVPDLGPSPADIPPDLGSPDVPQGYRVAWAPFREGLGVGLLKISARPGLGNDVVDVEISAAGFADVLGWAFDLKYHPGMLALEDISLENVLDAPTFEGRCVAKERGSGIVNVGCARFLIATDVFAMADYGAALEGPAVFARLRFRIREPGSSDIHFDTSRLLVRGALGSIPVAWEAGTVSITLGPLGGGR